jgi:hypothetical protein
MASFICICNPVKVWDYEGFFATKRDKGYWVFPEATFERVKPGDTLYLRVTTADKRPGVYGRFVALRKRRDECPLEFWRPGQHPAGFQCIVDFSIDAYFPTRRITPDDLRMAGVKPGSPLLRVPQRKAAVIDDDDAAITDGLVEARR